MAVIQREDSRIAFRGGVALFAGDEQPQDLSQPFDVEAGLTGQYKTRNFELTAKTFEQMAKNHADAGVDPAVDREHESWFSMAGNPALGWVKALDIKPASVDKRRSALVATVQFNNLGQEAVKQGHFRYVSMGMDKAGKHRMSGDSIGAVLDHLALVKNPFIQGMRPLSLALSSKLGRLVEEEPMEALAQKLRDALGLSADASEEQIIVAFNAAKAKDVAQATDREALTKALDEQKRINARLEDGFKQLTAAADARATAEWQKALKAKVDEFTISPAEAAELEKLTGAERDVMGRMLALRQVGALKPAAVANPTIPGAGNVVAANGKGTLGEAMGAPQLAAIEAFKKSNPGVDDMAAFTGAMLANPGLFTHEGA